MATVECPYCHAAEQRSSSTAAPCRACRRPYYVPGLLDSPAQTADWAEVLFGGAAVVGTVAVVAGGAYVAAKTIQALFDEEYDTRLLPAGVRGDLIDEHVAGCGYWCPGWGRAGHRVRKRDLSVDHIIPWSKGGRTSVQNSQILCSSCNSAKGATMSVLDWLRGR